MGTSGRGRSVSERSSETEILPALMSRATQLCFACELRAATPDAVPHHRTGVIGRQLYIGVAFLYFLVSPHCASLQFAQFHGRDLRPFRRIGLYRVARDSHPVQLPLAQNERGARRCQRSGIATSRFLTIQVGRDRTRAWARLSCTATPNLHHLAGSLRPLLRRESRSAPVGGAPGVSAHCESK